MNQAGNHPRAVPALPEPARRAAFRRGWLLTMAVVIGTTTLSLWTSLPDLWSAHPTHKVSDVIFGCLLLGLFCRFVLLGGGFSTGCLGIFYVLLLFPMAITAAFLPLSTLFPGGPGPSLKSGNLEFHDLGHNFKDTPVLPGDRRVGRVLVLGVVSVQGRGSVPEHPSARARTVRDSFPGVALPPPLRNNPRMLPKPAKAVAFQLVSFAVAAVVLLGVSRLVPLDQLLHRIDGWIHTHRPWSTLCYPLVHATCNLLLLPAGVLVVGSGFLFGLWQGFALALTGHLLGAAGAFWISRTFGRRFIERHLASRPQWRELDAAVAREGWKIVLLSQMSPVFPTSLFNYCYGLTRLRFWPCLGWIALGWSPGMFLYALIGRLGHAGYRTYREGGPLHAHAVRPLAGRAGGVAGRHRAPRAAGVAAAARGPRTRPARSRHLSGTLRRPGARPAGVFGPAGPALTAGCRVLACLVRVGRPAAYALSE